MNDFINGETFSDFEELQSNLFGWVWWYNNERSHSSLGYKTPIESRESDEIVVTDEKISKLLEKGSYLQMTYFML